MGKAYEFLKGKDIVVNCKTEEEAKEFLEILDGDGIEWVTGNELITKNNWGEYKEHTCYRINNYKKNDIRNL